MTACVRADMKTNRKNIFSCPRTPDVLVHQAYLQASRLCSVGVSERVVGGKEGSRVI